MVSRGLLGVILTCTNGGQQLLKDLRQLPIVGTLEVSDKEKNKT